MYFTWESLTLGCTEYWINIPSSVLVQTHRRTDRSCDFTLRAWPRNLPSHTHSPGSASTREDRKATAGRTVYTKVFSIRAVSQPTDSGKDNKQRWEGTQSFWSLDSCFHHQYSMLRLLILSAKNAPWNSISTHIIIQTVSHIDSARSQCFGRTVRGMNHHQRCLRVQSIWDTVGLILDMSAQSLIVPKNLLTSYRGMNSSPESWQTLQGIYLRFPTRPQFDIQLGEVKNSCCIS